MPVIVNAQQGMPEPRTNLEDKKMPLNTTSGQQGIHEPGTGLENPELKEQMQGEAQGMQYQNQVKAQVKNVEAVEVQQNLGNGQQMQMKKGLDVEKLKGQLRQGTQSERSLARRSEVANAVQSMVKVAERNKGVGDQIRIIAQNQNQLQLEAEDALANAQKRNRFSKFLIGPNYGQLKEVEDRLIQHNEKLEELKNLSLEISDADKVLLEEQINAMEIITAELEGDLLENEKGFSLFGWLNRLISK